MSRVAVLAGVGPGTSTSIARELAEHGWSVALLARGDSYIESLSAEIDDSDVDALPIRMDMTDQVEVQDAFAEIRRELGTVDLLVNHAASFRPGGITDLDADDFEEMWRGCAYGGFLCSQAALPDMLERNDGTIIFTGANVGKRAQKDSVGFSSAKFAVRGLADGMARELGPRGIHVAHVVIHGQIDTPRTRQYLSEVDPSTLLDPDEIAKTYRHLAHQSSRCWTTEIDLRTYREKS